MKAQPDTLPAEEEWQPISMTKEKHFRGSGMACQDATPDKKGGKAPLDFDRHKGWIEPRDLILLPGPPERKKGKKTKDDKAKPFVHGLIGVGCISHDQCTCEVDHRTLDF